MGWLIYRRLVPPKARQVIGLVAVVAFLYVSPFRAWVIGVIADQADARAERFVDQVNDHVNRVTASTTTTAP